MRSSLLLVVCVLVVLPSRPAAAQGSCEASVLSRMERDTKQFREDVQREGIRHTREEMGEASLAAAKDLLDDRPSAQALFDLRERWNKWKEAVEQGRKALDDVGDCRPNYANSCLLEVAKRQNEQLRREWLLDLAGDKINEIAEKVEKVKTLYAGYAERAFGTAQDSINNYLNSCTTQIEARVQTQTTTNAGGANANGGGTAGAAAPSGGMSKSTMATLVALAGAGGVAAWALMPVEEFDDFSTTPTTPTTSTPQPTTPAGTSQFNGTYRATVTRNCTAPAGVVCAQFTQSSCSPTAFSFTVSNGQVSDCGPWLTRSTVQSNGTFSGVYSGSAPNGVPLNGVISSSGTGTLSGQSTQGGAQYTVSIQVSRQ